MGYKQNLDNGVMGKPIIPGPQERVGTQEATYKNLKFLEAIAHGNNELGQTTIAPGQVVHGGHCEYNTGGIKANDPKSGKRWSPKNF